MVTLPNDDIVSSSHISKSNLPQLPQAVKRAYVVPGLASHSLVSVVKLCNAGCEVNIRDILCNIRYSEKMIVKCRKCTRTGVWVMPLKNTTEQIEREHN